MGLYLTEKHLKYKDGKDDHVSPFFIYHNNNKRAKFFCSLKVNNKNWCFDKKKVKSTDKEAGQKNRKIKGNFTKMRFQPRIPLLLHVIEHRGELMLSDRAESSI